MLHYLLLSFYVHRATATHRGQVIFKDALAQQLCEQGGKRSHHLKKKTAKCDFSLFLHFSTAHYESNFLENFPSGPSLYSQN